jgi:Glyoxalase-like domain
MTIQLRQICLVAEKLAPVIADLTDILGLEACYVDPGVKVFGLENTLLPIGRNFLEVVAPIRENTAGGRYLQRRGGDGGYMVITQADTRQAQADMRNRAQANGVRVAYEHDQDGWNLCQFHPGDMIAAFLEVEWDRHEDLAGHWMPAGGSGWEPRVRQDVTQDIVGVELQGEDPVALADLWSRVLGAPLEAADGAPVLALNNAALTFVQATDGRGPGLSGLTLAVHDLEGIKGRAKARGRVVRGDKIDICGVWFELIPQGRG